MNAVVTLVQQRLELDDAIERVGAEDAADLLADGIVVATLERDPHEEHAEGVEGLWESHNRMLRTSTNEQQGVRKDTSKSPRSRNPLETRLLST